MSRPQDMRLRYYKKSQVSSAEIDSLLGHRLILVAGKGGTGRTTMAAALALTAARRGMEVLAIDACGNGQLAAALGGKGTAFTATRVRHRISVIYLRPEDAMAEYLHEFFRVPRLARYTPVSRIFDFIATTVPGPRDMLMLGKMAYEVRAHEGARRKWDLVIADTQPTGQIVRQLSAPQTMRRLFPGGLIAGHIKLVESVFNNPQKAAVVLCTLAEEMPAAEALELDRNLQELGSVQAKLCFLNRIVPLRTGRDAIRKLDSLLASETAADLNAELDDGLTAASYALRTGMELRQAQGEWAEVLKQQLSVPVLDVALKLAKPGLAVARAISEDWLEH